MGLSSKIHILFCVERGVLEEQAILLVNSINKFFPHNGFQIHAYSPRIDSQPTISTLDFFEKNDVDWVSANLNAELKQYPIANKVLACCHFERNNPEKKNILFVDTDTVFLNPIDINPNNSDEKILLRPVDNKGPGSEGDQDSNDYFWRKIFELFSLELPKNMIKTTVGQSIIKYYFNAGFIWAHNLPGFFEQWQADFYKILDSGLRPSGYQSREKNNFRCLDQVALAVTTVRFKNNLEVLPITYNYPIPFRPKMRKRKGHPNFGELIHIHYHKWFQHPLFIDHVTNAEEKSSSQYKWLKACLPISPGIDGAFKC